MYTAIKGIYENGVLTFTETPPTTRKSEVVVLFMEEATKSHTEPNSPKKGVVLGSHANKGYSIPDDFNQPLDDLKDYM
ncbi:hypothetical protein [Dyadobacter bucti]|jgi:hypothetical protein|uniref:hypothetical protein n=1 Tax=Dyadobacter bucti TaxID=2572203 RepID=UPI0011081B28|nr:hypothetical protein [Dyadobacter bucti]